MPKPSAPQGLTAGRLFIAMLGGAFLLFSGWSFFHAYLLHLHGVTAQASVVRLHILRRRGSVIYKADYAFDYTGKHFEDTGDVSPKSFTELRPGSPIAIRYEPQDPENSETVEMSHYRTTMWLTGVLGLPAALFILFMGLRADPLRAGKSQDVEPEAVNNAPRRFILPTLIEGIAFTMYPVTDMPRARRFYEGDLGLKVAHEVRNTHGDWIEYHLWDNCFAITTMLQGAVTPSANAGGSIAFEVNDVDAFVAELKKKGTPIKREPFSTPVCRMAVVLDPEGNALSLHQRTTPS